MTDGDARLVRELANHFMDYCERSDAEAGSPAVSRAPISTIEAAPLDAVNVFERMLADTPAARHVWARVGNAIARRCLDDPDTYDYKRRDVLELRERLDKSAGRIVVECFMLHFSRSECAQAARFLREVNRMPKNLEPEDLPFGVLSLDLSGLGLQTIPSSLQCLKRLRILNLDGNPLTRCDLANKGGLPNLRWLSAANCKLRFFDVESTGLEWLNLSGNALESIGAPASRRFYPRLRRAMFARNRFASVPRTLRCALLLEEIDFSDNPVATLPGFERAMARLTARARRWDAPAAGQDATAQQDDGSSSREADYLEKIRELECRKRHTGVTYVWTDSNEVTRTIGGEVDVENVACALGKLDRYVWGPDDEEDDSVAEQLDEVEDDTVDDGGESEWDDEGDESDDVYDLSELAALDFNGGIFYDEVRPFEPDEVHIETSGWEERWYTETFGRAWRRIHRDGSVSARVERSEPRFEGFLLVERCIGTGTSDVGIGFHEPIRPRLFTVTCIDGIASIAYDGDSFLYDVDDHLQKIESCERELWYRRGRRMIRIDLDEWRKRAVQSGVDLGKRWEVVEFMARALHLKTIAGQFRSVRHGGKSKEMRWIMHLDRKSARVEWRSPREATKR